MNISLSPETQKLLEQRLQQGGYQSADDVVHAALEALNELETEPLDEKTLDAIDRAEDQIERGEFRDLDEIKDQIRAKFTE